MNAVERECFSPPNHFLFTFYFSRLGVNFLVNNKNKISPENTVQIETLLPSIMTKDG